MVKIAFVTSYIKNNGPGRVIQNIIDNLDLKEFEISIITLFDKNDSTVVERFKTKGIIFYDCKGISNTRSIFQNAKEFTDIFEKCNFDIIHSHGIVPDILCSRLNKEVNRISTVHCNVFEDYKYRFGMIKGVFLAYSHIKALKKLELVTCCSKSVYDALRSYNITNINYIHNGINEPSSHSKITRNDLSIPKDAKVFIYTGSLSKRKNIQHLIHLFNTYHNNDEYLLILGRGQKEKTCKRIADSHVRFLGFQKDPIMFMNISDIYISSSKSEGFSIAVLEALFCGLGLFLSDIPSHKEVVSLKEKNEIGLLFSDNNFSSQIIKLRQMHFNKNAIICYGRKIQKRVLSFDL